MAQTAQGTMSSIRLSQGMSSPAGWAIFLCLLAGAIYTYLWLRPTMAAEASSSPSEHISHPTPARQGVHLAQVTLDRDEADTDIDIIAIHGLDTKSPDTWLWRSKDSNKPDINWLADSHMLPRQAKGARIFTCDWPADLLQSSDLVQKTIEEYALLLLDGVQRELWGGGARRESRPILFIASCLGGIVLMKALVRADDKKSSYRGLRSAARGIVFLATPFRGTSFQDVAAWAEPGLRARASIQGREVSKLLGSVKSSTFDLEELVRKFTQLCQDKHSPCQVFNFYELGTTSLPRKVFPWLPAWFHQGKQLVDRSSATLDIVTEPLPLHRRHSLMNKFHSPECADYKKVADKIGEMVGKICEGTPLEQADAWIRDKHYTEERLRIERLSGERLPMDKCYINLAIVEQSGQDAGRSKEKDTTPSPFTLLSRQNVQTPNKTIQVKLPTLFSQRIRRSGGTIEPRRILIRGRAGVGKTTLCKKMVHDFAHNTHTELHRSWTKLFDRLLWVPLRRLKGQRDRPYNLGKLFHIEYFSQLKDKDGQRLAHTLWDATPQHGSRTLLILDGLDEVSGEWNPDDDMSRFLESLLNHPNVVITSRPSGILPAGLRPFDLELETIGFYPDQVKAYLEADPKMKPRAKEVQSFLQERWLMQGLVRIPIQLDALCYTWDDPKPGTVPDTMTGIYKAIEKRLWKKDAVRLDKKHDGKLVTASQIGTAEGVEDLVKGEIYFLEGLAFTGLQNDVIDFTPRHRQDISKQFRPQGILLDKMLPCLSFLRTSDPTSESRNQTYHFIHLTFQEYFAARYFERQWKAGRPLKCLELGSGQIEETEPASLLRQHKYTARYDIFWRFVAGLLDAGREASGFFEAIEEEPLDLLGPTHQRLVMHCLSEVGSSIELQTRSNLEEKLSQWLLFECDFAESSFLARESECPDGPLHNALERASSRARLRILEALQHPGRHLSKATLTALTALLQHADADVRSRAADALGRQSTLPEATLTALTALLRDGNWRVRSRAADALGGQSTLPEATLTALTALLPDEDDNVRPSPTEALGRQSTLPEATLTALTALLWDGDECVRSRAAEALRGKSTLPEATLTTLTALLRDADADVQSSAADALRGQSALPEATLTALTALLQDGNWRVRLPAAEALQGKSALPEATLTALTALLQHADDNVRSRAADALGRQSTLPEATLTALTALLRDGNGRVRWLAVEALQGQSALPEATLTALTALLRDGDSLVPLEAASAIGRQSTLPEATLTALTALLQDEDKDIRLYAIFALGDQSALPEATLTALTALLRDEDESIRLCAAKVFGGQSTLSDKILEAVGLLLEPERQTETTSSTIRNPEFVASLYGSLLWRSFREQSSFYVDGHDSCIINQPRGLRKASFEQSSLYDLQTAVHERRQLWNIPGYKLWDSFE